MDERTRFQGKLRSDYLRALAAADLATQRREENVAFEVFHALTFGETPQMFASR